MGLLDNLKLDVHVESNGRQVPEFDVPADQHPAGATDVHVPEFTSPCNKYIEVTEDATFSIRVSCPIGGFKLWHQYYNNISCWVTVDGHEAPSGPIMRHSYDGLHIQGVKEISEWGSIAKLRRYRFQAIQTTDDTNLERVRKETSAAKALGLIQVKVYRVRILQSGISCSSVPSSFQNLASLPEKALKGRAVSHGTALANPEPIDMPVFHDVRYIDENLTCQDGKLPIAVFNFWYRSRDALKSEGVIPRSPSPVAEAVAEPNVDDLSLDQLREIAKEHLEQKKLKREQQGRAPKREADLTDVENIPPARPVKMAKTRDGQDAIDLTDD